MCGRFTLTTPIDEIKQHFYLKQAAALLTPRYNIAPNQVIVIVKNNILEFANWGFKLNNTSNIIINLKLETILEKKYFNYLFKTQRCLVVASGFFEWKLIDNKKVPFYISVAKQNTIGFAGILNKDRCVILTTSANCNKYKNTVHNRVPVIIDRTKYKLWLDNKTPVDILQHSTLQIPQEDLSIYPVSSQVNNPRFDYAECIKPLS